MFVLEEGDDLSSSLKKNKFFVNKTNTLPWPVIQLLLSEFLLRKLWTLLWFSCFEFCRRIASVSTSFEIACTHAIVTIILTTIWVWKTEHKPFSFRAWAMFFPTLIALACIFWFNLDFYDNFLSKFVINEQNFLQVLKWSFMSVLWGSVWMDNSNSSNRFSGAWTLSSDSKKCEKPLKPFFPWWIVKSDNFNHFRNSITRINNRICCLSKTEQKIKC